MSQTGGPTDLPVDPTLLEEVRSVLAEAPPTAPEDLTGARSSYTGLAVGDPDLQKRLSAVADHLPGVAEPGSVHVHRHDIGDFTLPRRVGDTTDEAWALIFPLSDSEADGVTAWIGDRFARFLDRRGTGLFLPPQAWAWVSPVRAAPRYSVVMEVR